MSGYFLGIDNGGSNTKPRSGWTERDLTLVWSETAAIIKEAVAKAGVDPAQILSIGLTGYGNGICVVDENCEPTYNGIVSSDNRCAELCEQLIAAGVQDKIYPLTYQEFWPSQTAVLLRWLKDNAPECLEKAAWVLSIKDYIRMKLTGDACCELTETTCNGLMNIFTNEFAPAIFSELGLSDYLDLMPRVVGTAEMSGRVTAAAAQQTGLVAGIPVAGSCYDVNAAALACGVEDDSTLCLVAGTWSINEYLTKKLIYGANSIARSYLPDYYLLEDSSPTSASNFDWFVENFLKADGKTTKQIYDECTAAVRSLPAEDSDVIFIPYLFASMTHPDAKAAFFNLTSYCGKAQMIRAIYEGVVFSSMMHVEELYSYGTHFDIAVLAGGVANSEVWSQMMCDVVNLPMKVSTASEQGALGAAMCAAVAAGVYKDLHAAIAAMVSIKKTYEPDAAAGAVLRRKYEKYKKAVKALDGFYDALAEE